jgi:hypothetical protein
LFKAKICSRRWPALEFEGESLKTKPRHADRGGSYPATWAKGAIRGENLLAASEAARISASATGRMQHEPMSGRSIAPCASAGRPCREEISP